MKGKFKELFPATVETKLEFVKITPEPQLQPQRRVNQKNLLEVLATKETNHATKAIDQLTRDAMLIEPRKRRDKMDLVSYNLKHLPSVEYS